MSAIYPFAALRPTPKAAPDVASVPYDVVNSDEARALAHGKPLSFLHVSRPEIDLAAGANPHSDAAYDQAANAFASLRDQAPLVVEDIPSFYVYRLRMGNHVQSGIAACFSLDEYDRDLIKKHEKTRPDKEDDRTRHMLAIGAQTGPVFLTYRDDAAVTALVEAKVNEAPLHDFTAPDGIRHTAWRVAGGEEWVKAFGRVPLSYIADGHHRAASAARVARLRRAQNPQHAGTEDYNWFLCVLFPASELKILPYNRLVLDLNGFSPADFLAKVKTIFGLEENASPVLL